MSFGNIRNEFFSIYYHLKDLFSSYDPNVSVIQSFKDTTVNVPTVVITPLYTDAKQRELGTSKLDATEGHYLIEVVSLNRSQQQEMTQKVLDYLEEVIKWIDYSNGFPGDAGYIEVQLGILDPYGVSAKAITWGSLETSDADAYRAEVSLSIQRST